MTSSKLKIPKTPSPNTTKMGFRASTYEFDRTIHSIHNKSETEHLVLKLSAEDNF